MASYHGIYHMNHGIFGVFQEYTTFGLGHRKFAALINPSLRSGFIKTANFL